MRYSPLSHSILIMALPLWIITGIGSIVERRYTGLWLSLVFIGSTTVVLLRARYATRSDDDSRPPRVR